MFVFGFCGWSGSGKTDLICRIISSLNKKRISVSTIKHTHHDVSIDKTGKDSFKHKESGAKEVLFGGGSNWTLIHTGKASYEYQVNDLIKKMSKDNDLIIVEGFKKSKIPKLEVYNSQRNKTILAKGNDSIVGIVCDKISAEVKGLGIPVFDFHETEKISNFIIEYKSKNEKK